MNKKIVGIVGLLMLVSSMAGAQEECFSGFTPSMEALSGLTVGTNVSAPNATVT